MHDSIDVKIVDNFYKNPDIVREEALKAQYFDESPDVTGLRSNPFFEKRIRERIKRKFKMEMWDFPRERDFESLNHARAFANGSFFLAHEDEQVCVHADEPNEYYVVLIYLNPTTPKWTGTSFFRHKSSGWTHAPTKRDADKVGLSHYRAREFAEDDGLIRLFWEEILRVDAKYNRAVCYKGGQYHSATQHYGMPSKEDRNDTRIYQLFRFAGYFV